jgi:uncharacterized protein (DUF1330 family)
MSAYVIFIRRHTAIPAELKTYSQKAPASLAGRRLKIHALYGHHHVVEGPEIEGAAILEFPSIEEAREWYDSPAYREARDHRLRGADYIGIIVEGYVHISAGEREDSSHEGL